MRSILIYINIKILCIIEKRKKRLNTEKRLNTGFIILFDTFKHKLKREIICFTSKWQTHAKCKIWNAIPDSLRQNVSITEFKVGYHKLKTMSHVRNGDTYFVL